MQPLFLKPVFKEMIWGGSALRELFNYDIPSDNTGECWAIRAHNNGDCMVTTKEGSDYSGKTLSELWKNNSDLPVIKEKNNIYSFRLKEEAVDMVAEDTSLYNKK